jgi:hypothetical protein
MASLAHEMGLREAGRLIGRGREGVRKLISGEVENPHPRTRQAIGELLIQRQKAAEAQEGAAAPGEPPAPQAFERPVEAHAPMPLRLILPRPLERATGEIRALFALIREHPGAPDTAQAVEQWLLRQVRREYAAESTYERGRRRKGDPPGGR